MMTNTDVELWVVIGFSVKTYQACQGAPIQPGGVCEKCGQGIKYVVTLKSTRGQILNVGQDCAVTLEGGPELAEIRRAERRWEQSEWERLHGAEHRARIAGRAAAEEAARVKNEAHLAMTLAGLRMVRSSDRASTWDSDRAQALLNPIEKGLTTEDISDEDKLTMSMAITRIFAPDSRHVGNVGERIETVAMLEVIIAVGVDSMYGPKRMHKFRTSNGEVLTWFATGSSGAYKEEIGKPFKVKGTVKKHDTYQGVKQTILTRCKLSPVE